MIAPFKKQICFKYFYDFVLGHIHSYLFRAHRLVHLQTHIPRLCWTQNKDPVGLSESLSAPVQLDKSLCVSSSCGTPGTFKSGRALHAPPPSGGHSEAQPDGPNSICLD